MAWTRLARPVALATLPLLLAVWAFWPDGAVVVSRVVHALSVLAAATAMFVAARTGDPRLRRSRAYFAGALAASALGFAVASGYAVVLGRVPVPSLADVAALAWVPCAVIGFVLLPTEEHREGGRLRAMCDALIASTALFLASWMVVLQPIYEHTQRTGLAKATLLAYPIVDVVVAVTALSIARHVRRDLRRFLHLATGGMLLVALSDSGAAVNLANGFDGFSWTNIVLQAGLLLLLWAALVPSRPGDRAGGQVDAVIDAALPFLPVVIATIVGLPYVMRGGAFGSTEALIGAAMVAGLLARQVLFAKHLGAVAYRLSVDAGHDSLTGLANRRAFLNALDTSVSETEPGTVAVALFDLDGFKEINDGFGHAAGDDALIEFAARLRDSARNRGTAARLGGDEFALLVAGGDAEFVAVAVAHELTQGLRVRIGVAEVPIGASAGIAVNRHGDTASLLLRRADQAMYHAKRSGISQTAIFTDDMASRSERRHLLAQALPGAAERGELELRYQPLYRLEGGTLAGAQALLRWHHPLYGEVAPPEFLPIAAEIGVTEALGAWVLTTAARQVRHWEMAGRRLAHLFVNAAAHQLTESSAATVIEITREHHLPTGTLTLEIAQESLLSAQSLSALRVLRGAGVGVAVEDFGAAVSSLAQLSHLPIDSVKITPDLVRATHNPNGRRIFSTIVELAHGMGLQAVVEGVERPEEAAVARDAGCALAQGRYLGRPVTVQELTAMMTPLAAESDA